MLSTQPTATAATLWLMSQDIQNYAPYSLVHIRRLEAQGKFPKRIKLGDNRIAWRRDEVEAWVDARIAERDQQSAGS